MNGTTALMRSNLMGRVRNTQLPAAHGLLPVFEAVINSLHAIAARELPADGGTITVVVKRQSALPTGRKPSDPVPPAGILGFDIVDNGVGFTDENMDSFRTLDSDYKIDKGGRGVGRLLWLKAFENVRIHSNYLANGDTPRMRQFSFSARQGIEVETGRAEEPLESLQTVVSLVGLRPRYKAISRSSGESIALQLLEHCLWFYIRDVAPPDIRVQDGNDVYSLRDLFANQMSAAPTDEIAVKDAEFRLTHIKRRHAKTATHQIAWCADDRVVSTESLTTRIAGLGEQMADDKGDFVYWCYVSSGFLDERARPERTGFEIPERVGALFAETEIGFDEVRKAVVARAQEHLSMPLTESRENARERIRTYVNRRAPRYRPIVDRIPDADLYIDPSMHDDELELFLHKKYSSFEREVLKEGQSIMDAPVGDDIEDYRNRLQDYMQRAEDLKKSDLAQYVFHRRVVLDLFEKSIQRDSRGQFVREHMVHNMVMPLRKDSSELGIGEGNLWLLDERLAFHHYLASDKPLTSMSVTESRDLDRPDMTSMTIHDEPILTAENDAAPWTSLGIVEFKRPMLRGATQDGLDPIEKVMRYVAKIRQGGVQTTGGRPIPGGETVPAFCYIVADLTGELVERCKVHDLTQTADFDRWVGYKRAYALFIEVMSFDHVVKSAKQRNRAFFEKLGVPTR